MACLGVLIVSLVVLQSAQLSWGDIIELDKFHGEPANYVELTFAHKPRQRTAAAADFPSLELDSLKSVSVNCYVVWIRWYS